jgi:transposase
MIDTACVSYYTFPMSMGKRKRDRQPPMWITTTDLPTAGSHPFDRRLNRLLREQAFDDFVEAQCAGFLCGDDGPAGIAAGDLLLVAADRLFRGH